MPYPSKPWTNGQTAEIVAGTIFSYDSNSNVWVRVNKTVSDAQLDSELLNVKADRDSDLSLLISNDGGTFTGQVTFQGEGDSLIVSNTLRVNGDGGFRLTGVGAFDANDSDFFRIFSTSNLVLGAGGETGTALEFSAATKQATFYGDITTAGTITAAQPSFPSFLVFGDEPSYNNQITFTEAKTTNGTQNGQGWRSPVGGTVTHITCQLDCQTAVGDFEVELYKNGTATGKTVTFTLVAGDSGATAAITNEDFNADDRLSVFWKHASSGARTEQHAFTLRVLTAS